MRQRSHNVWFGQVRIWCPWLRQPKQFTAALLFDMSIPLRKRLNWKCFFYANMKNSVEGLSRMLQITFISQRLKISQVSSFIRNVYNNLTCSFFRLHLVDHIQLRKYKYTIIFPLTTITFFRIQIHMLHISPASISSMCRNTA